MTKNERIAVEKLDLILNADRQPGVLPVARKLSAALNRSIRASYFSKKKEDAFLRDAIKEFDSHPVGPGQTDSKYLICSCGKKGNRPVAINGICVECNRKRL